MCFSPMCLKTGLVLLDLSMTKGTYQHDGFNIPSSVVLERKPRERRGGYNIPSSVGSNMRSQFFFFFLRIPQASVCQIECVLPSFHPSEHPTNIVSVCEGTQEPGEPHLYPGADVGGERESITQAPVLGWGRGRGGSLHCMHPCLPATADGNSMQAQI